MPEDSFLSKGFSSFGDQLFLGRHIDWALEPRLASQKIGKFLDGLEFRRGAYTGVDSFGISFLDRWLQERTDGPLSRHETFLVELGFLAVGRVDDDGFEHQGFAVVIGGTGFLFDLGGVGVFHESKEL